MPRGIEGTGFMDHSKEAAVRARAYQLWVESGYADGYQDQHWRQAEREVAEKDGDGADGTGGAVQAPQPPSAGAGRHSDGMSRHPSVLDPGPGR